MEAKKVKVGYLEVNYLESKGTGPAVLFVHGNSCSSKVYLPQLEGKFGQKYRAVAMDLPGHGNSTQAKELSEYSMPGYAMVVAAVAKALDMEDAVLVGWSLGGHIILEAHNLLPNAAGFVIYGTPPLSFPPDMENAFLPNPAMAMALSGEATEEQMKAFAAACFAPEAQFDMEAMLADIKRTDGRARAGLAASMVPDGYADEIEIVKELDRPLAVLHGEHEQLVNLDYFQNLDMPTLWRKKVHVIPNAGHAPHFENPDRFNELLSDFVDEVAKMM